MNLLLLSNSIMPGRPFLGHALDEIDKHLRGRELLFIPYALQDHDAYTAKVATALDGIVSKVNGLHTCADPARSLDEAEAVFVGGGNMFRLVTALYALEVVPALRAFGRSQRPYLGSSAGTLLPCPSMRTTNDMPIVRPPSFETLGVLPFQINPHYLDPDPESRHMGETRDRRIEEFLEQNDAVVVGLREGSMLRIEDSFILLLGANLLKVFRRGESTVDLGPDDDLTFLMSASSTFDRPQLGADVYSGGAA